MKPINFLHTQRGEGERLLAHCWANGFGWLETRETLKDAGFYIPWDQWDAFQKLIDIQCDLDIGTRKEEVPCDSTTSSA